MSDRAVYAGIDIGGTSIKYGLVDRNGNVLFREQRPTMVEKGAEPRGGAPELDDPIGQDLETYRRQFGIIRNCIDHLLLHVKHAP